MTVPTLESVEFRIITDLQTALESIATDHPSVEFFTDVESVHFSDQPPGDWATLDLPTIVVVGHDEESAYYDSTGLTMKRVLFDCYAIRVREPDTWKRDIYRMASDIERAVLVDPRRGATLDGQPNAFDTTVLSTAVANLVAGNEVAMARVSVAVDFRTDVNDPTQSG